MTTESTVNENQHFSVATTDEQRKILEAKDLLKQCRDHVRKASHQKDYEALALLPKIDGYINNA